MSTDQPQPQNARSLTLPGDYLLPLRLVIGWTYFSAFWRRLVLENKLDPDAAGYVGEKFNHFLPNALGIGPIIEFFVSHPELLWWKLLIFTLVEAVVGFAIFAGFLTRWMGLGIALLAFGILLGAGWLGTTCLDEWQLSLLGMGGGITLFWVGGGRHSVDYILEKKGIRLPLIHKLDPLLDRLRSKYWISAIAALLLGLTLFTNQVFHGGVWGTLHNKSVAPQVELSNARIADGELSLELYRYEGADVYGSFAIELSILSSSNEKLVTWTATDLSELSLEKIHNRYVAKIKPGKHSLVIPLGARATLHLSHARLSSLPVGTYQVQLVDINGTQWQTDLSIE